MYCKVHYKINLVRAPLKIFGDIHGQYSDLMSFFALYGSPF
jgi:protein phosphatase